jgi:HAMP domain-containing protein
MASNLTNQVRSISLVTKAVAYGDLEKTIDVDVSGEMLDLKMTINEMVMRLGNFSREVTRVALEVGTEGKLGGQAEVEGVQGTWRDLTDNVNVRIFSLYVPLLTRRAENGVESDESGALDFDGDQGGGLWGLDEDDRGGRERGDTRFEGDDQ